MTGNIIPGPWPGSGGTVDNQTQADEEALLLRIEAVIAGGDGVEAGPKTTEFWLVSLAVVIDVFGPSWGLLQGISPAEQGLIAFGLALGYTAFRSWRKRGAPAAALLAGLVRAGKPVPEPAPAPEPPAAPAEVLPAA